MLAPALGLESEHRILQFRAEITQEAAKSLHFNALDLVTDGGEIQNCALCGQIHGTSEHDSCVPCAYIDAELAQVILMWTLLSTMKRRRSWPSPASRWRRPEASPLEPSFVPLAPVHPVPFRLPP